MSAPPRCAARPTLWSRSCLRSRPSRRGSASWCRIMGRTPQLLVSVRDVAEAMSARAGGADVIDIKEPKRGPLGRADDAVVSAVRNAVGHDCLVSAALG